MLGLVDAEHEESAPDATTLLINRLACSLVGQTQSIQLVPGSQVAAAYGQPEAVEDFYCNYGFNPAFAIHFHQRALHFAAFDQEGEVRAVELRGHPFYIATLFLPQMRSHPGQPHRLILAYLQAASAV